MTVDHDSAAAMPDARGESPFATARNRTILGKLALALSLLPWAAFGLIFVFQPG